MWNFEWKSDDLTRSLHVQTHYSAVRCSFHVNLVSLFGSGWESQPEQQLLATQTILFMPNVDHITLTLSAPEAPWRTKAQGGPLTVLVFSHIHGLFLLEVKCHGVWFLAMILHDVCLAVVQISTWEKKTNPNNWISTLVCALTSLHSCTVECSFLIGQKALIL